MQVDPIKPTLKVPGTKRLKLKYYEPLSSFAFKLNLRRYTTGVYVGIGTHEYHDHILMPHGLAVHALVAPGNATSAASGRASFMFGLSGAALSVVGRCRLTPG